MSSLNSFKLRGFACRCGCFRVATGGMTLAVGAGGMTWLDFDFFLLVAAARSLLLFTCKTPFAIAMILTLPTSFRAFHNSLLFILQIGASC